MSQTRREFLHRSLVGTLVARGACRGLLAPGPAGAAVELPPAKFEPIEIPAWVHQITRMAFLAPDQLDAAAECGVEVVHGNAVWPYYPLQRDGGGLPAAEDSLLRQFVEGAHRHGMKLVLGLPPFPSVAHVRAHPDWRVDPDGSGAALAAEPREDNLGTRLGCNLGPWGDYLIDVCADLIEHYGVDGYSFDGNYHAAICFCPACRAAYRHERSRELPPRANLDDVSYREYLVWRGEKLEGHYRQLQRRIKAINPDAVIMSWTVNAGRYGQLLYSPRAMPTRLNLLFDLPMQEWWLDETNLGASIAPAFGAAYLAGTTGGRPCGSEPYLMSRGNPYGPDSFPLVERKLRTLLATTHGCLAPQSFGWLGGVASASAAFDEIKVRRDFLGERAPVRWLAMLVSEQTRQFYAYQAIAERFLPHVFGAFRGLVEEHRCATLINDWDLVSEELAAYAVLLLPNAVALSAEQANAVRAYVAGGGGLVATGETSLCDELGRPRGDFALADLYGASYRGRPQAVIPREQLDANFAVTIDEAYWRDRVGTGYLAWTDHPLVADAGLARLVPDRRVRFKGPLVVVSEPQAPGEVVARATVDGLDLSPTPAIVARSFGRGRVVYLAAALDAALWSYAYPYQRRLLGRAIDWVANRPQPIEVHAPMCVHAAYYERPQGDQRQVLVHLFNDLNSAAGHGLPAVEVPLREEVVRVAGIRVRFRCAAPRAVRLEPGGQPLDVRVEGPDHLVDVPPLAMHAIVTAQFER